MTSPGDGGGRARRTQRSRIHSSASASRQLRELVDRVVPSTSTARDSGLQPRALAVRARNAASCTPRSSRARTPSRSRGSDAPGTTRSLRTGSRRSGGGRSGCGRRPGRARRTGAVEEELLRVGREVLPRGLEVDVIALGDRLGEHPGRSSPTVCPHRPRCDRALGQCQHRRVGHHQVGIDLHLRMPRPGAIAGTLRRAS